MLIAGLLALAMTAPLKVAVMPVTSGEGVPGKTAEALTESVTAEVRRRSGGQVITQREITTLLSLEQQKAMLGCQSDACFAELGGALGVERVVSGDLSRLGESWLFHLKLLDPGKAQVLVTSDRRLRGGTIDDLLDALPAMVAELFPPAKSSGAAASAASPKPAAGASAGIAAKPAGGAPVTPAVVELPATLEAAPGAEPEQEAAQEALPPATAPMPGRTPARAVRSAFLERSIPVPLPARRDLQVFGDGAGHFLAIAPFGEQESPVFFGRAKKLFRQQVLDRREHETTASGVAVWDPRVPGGRALVAVMGEEAVVRCGDRELSLRALPQRRRTAVLMAATFYAPPFVRDPVALARDDEGNFFFVDSAREPKGSGPDYRLYAGPKGALTRQEIEDIGRDGSAMVLRTARGRLRLDGQGDRGAKVDWVAGGGRRMLVPMDPAESQELVFGELGVYGQHPLGTPCDVVLGAQ